MSNNLVPISARTSGKAPFNNIHLLNNPFLAIVLVTLHHCGKISEINNVVREGFFWLMVSNILAHSCFAPSVWACDEYCGQRGYNRSEMLIS